MPDDRKLEQSRNRPASSSRLAGSAGVQGTGQTDGLPEPAEHLRRDQVDSAGGIEDGELWQMIAEGERLGIGHIDPEGARKQRA